MTEQEDTRRKSRRDLLLVLLILPLGVLCMFVTGQTAIRLAPTWVLNADMRSFLDPDSEFAGGGNQLFLEPLDPGILTPPAWGDLFLTPFAAIPTRVLPTATPPPPARTPQPPVVRNTPEEEEPTPTLAGPIILPTRPGPAIGDLAVEVTDNSSTYTPGTSITYTITVSNLGPDDALRFDLVDNVPAAISGLTVTCSPAAFCGTNESSGNTVSFKGMTLPYSGGLNAITISISGTVAAGATGNLRNTVEITIPGNVRYRDPNLSNNTATDRDTQRSVYDLAITKSDGVNTYTATAPLTYTIVVTNSVGPSDALDIRVTDNIPPQIASWTWTCTTVTNANGCNGVTNSTANFTDTIDIRVGGRIVYTVTAYPSGVSQNISNTANVRLPGGSGFVDPVPANNSATDTDIPHIDLGITKDDGGVSYTAGGTISYAVTVTNNSTFDLSGITISDPLPAQVTTWDWCVGSSCTGPINTSFSDTIDLPAGSSLVYTVTATISGTASTGNITNTVSVNAPAGLVDANPGNNSATDITPPYIDLQITKTDSADTYTPPGPVTYTVTVTNNSAIALNGIAVSDPKPALVTTWSWACAGGCNPVTNSAGDFTDTINLAAGTSLEYTVTANINANAAGPLVNTASVDPPAGFVDAVPGDNTSTYSHINADGEPDVGPPDGNIYPIPTGGVATFYLSQPIIANGDPAADFVFYENPMGLGIFLDLVLIEISADAGVWYPVFEWGDGVADTNTNVDFVNVISGICPTESDNCEIPSANLFNGTGITVDVDNSPLSGVPAGNYHWIRFTDPGTTDGTHVDAIEILP